MRELRGICKDGSPWVYVCAASFLDFLARLRTGGSAGPKEYKEFFRDYLGRVNAIYKTFTYKSGHQDLSIQAYHVLRCGIIHSFSLVADAQSAARDGRDRSIVLAHQYSAEGKKHLDNWISSSAPDAAIFVAEDFLSDIEKAFEALLNDAESDKKLKRKIIGYWISQPPIAANI